MNSKKAKQLRRILKVGGVDIKQVNYTQSNYHVVQEEGQSRFIDGVLTPEILTADAYTATLTPGCGREIYQTAKRGYKRC